jgi:cytochrome c-type biogenesis protein
MDYTNVYAVVDMLRDVIHEHLPVAIGLMLLGGILSSLSPSSVPRMVAIANYAGREAKSLLHATGLATAFVLGICTVYSGVGALAGSFGALLSVTGFLYYVTAALCLVMGLSMIRLVEINWQLPHLQSVGRGFVGAYTLGFGFAFLIAPDATPFMLGALTVTTFQGEIGLGALLMFFFGIGHGMPVLVAGVLAPWYMRHPAVQKWHLAAETAAGYVLVVLALFFVVIA